MRESERLKARVEESTYLTYTGFHDKTNQKYLEIKRRSTSEKSTNVMGEDAIQARWQPHGHPSRHIVVTHLSRIFFLVYIFQTRFFQLPKFRLYFNRRQQAWPPVVAASKTPKILTYEKNAAESNPCTKPDEDRTEQRQCTRRSKQQLRKHFLYSLLHLLPSAAHRSCGVPCHQNGLRCAL